MNHLHNRTHSWGNAVNSPEAQREAQRHHAEANANSPNHKGKLLVLALLVGGGLAVLLGSFISGSKAAPSIPNKFVTDSSASESFVKPSKTTKSTGNSGEKNNNFNVEGDHNTVHVGDTITNTTTVNNTTVVHVINKGSASKDVPPVVTTTTKTTTNKVVKRTECDDKNDEHLARVARWKAKPFAD